MKKISIGVGYLFEPLPARQIIIKRFKTQIFNRFFFRGLSTLKFAITVTKKTFVGVQRSSSFHTVLSGEMFLLVNILCQKALFFELEIS